MSSAMSAIQPLLFSNNVFKPCTCTCTATGIPPTITNRLGHVQHPGTGPCIPAGALVVHPASPFRLPSQSRRLCGHCSSHHQALAAGWRLIRVLRLFDLCDEKIKAPANVLVIASAGFCPGAVVLLRQLLSIIGADLALLGAEVALVAHDDDRDPLNAL